LAEIFSIRSPLSRRKSGRVSLLLFRLAILNPNENNTAGPKPRARARQSFTPCSGVFSESFSPVFCKIQYYENSLKPMEILRGPLNWVSHQYL
jgi:hypothetical protein